MDDGAVAGVFGFRGGNFFDPVNHGDDNRIRETVERIRTRIATLKAKKCKGAGDVDEILQLTGAVFHAVQDLYAHTTYIEEMQNSHGAEPFGPMDFDNLPSGTISGNYQYPRDNGTPPTHRDLNKDSPDSNRGRQPTAGGDSTLHQRAVELATEHTKQIWAEIKGSLDPTCLCELKKRCGAKP
jgi:hypothetical protein